MIDLKQIVHKDDGINVYIKGIEVEDGSIVPYTTFIGLYTEYIDPKDVEIQRLREEVAKLKEKAKKPRVTRRVILPGEKKEMIELIRKGESNTAIATEYKLSETVVSRYRVELRKAGEEV